MLDDFEPFCEFFKSLAFRPRISALFSPSQANDSQQKKETRHYPTARYESTRIPMLSLMAQLNLT